MKTNLSLFIDSKYIFFFIKIIFIIIIKKDKISKEIEEICLKIKYNQIEKIDYFIKGFNKEGIKRISELLKINNSLKQLYLRGNFNLIKIINKILYHFRL